MRKHRMQCGLTDGTLLLQCTAVENKCRVNLQEQDKECYVVAAGAIFAVMLVVFIVCAFFLRLPVGVGMIVASIVGALAAGEGIALRHLVEGAFGYLDTILVIATAMIFMRVLEENGALNEIGRQIARRFAGKPALLLMTSMLFIMFPGMITGAATTGILTTGAIIAPVLLRIGIPRVQAATILSMGGIFGMVAPPVNIPLMVISGGVDMPYVGFARPLLLIIVPLAFITVLALGYRHVRDADWEKLKEHYANDPAKQTSRLIYLPIIIVVVLMVLQQLFPLYVPNVGSPLIFMIAALSGLLSGDIRFLQLSRRAILRALPIFVILIGVGAFVQVMTLTGVRGMLVVSALSLPDIWLYLGMLVALPLFGAVSAFGSASVMGVPFMLALLGNDEIMVGVGLSLLASLGDLMPPTALAGMFAAEVLEIDRYVKVLRRALVPAAVLAAVGLGVIIFADQLAPILR